MKPTLKIRENKRDHERPKARPLHRSELPQIKDSTLFGRGLFGTGATFSQGEGPCVSIHFQLDEHHTYGLPYVFLSGLTPAEARGLASQLQDAADNAERMKAEHDKRDAAALAAQMKDGTL